MNKGNSDSFESGKVFEKNFEQSLSDTSLSEDNFFLTGDVNLLPPEPVRRLNNYDSVLLEEDAYKEVSDDLFKIEYKIARIEEELKEIDNRIQSARDIYDYDQIENLSGRKKQLKEERENLIKMYNEMSLSAKISDSILSVFGGRGKLEDKLPNSIKALQRGIKAFSDALLSKMPKKFSSAVELKKSLSRLESINKNVDELISMNIPYGENIDKYEKLSKYIIRANSIQNNISKTIK